MEEHKNTNLVVQENSGEDKGIHENMDTFEVAKNVFKGAFILGKRAAKGAVEMAERMKERAQELKNNRWKEYKMALVKVDIKCKCGKILQTRNVYPESKSKTTGSIICSNCKRNMRYEIIGDRVSVYEKGK